MSFSAIITLAAAGADAGPFDLYSNIDSYVTAFETGVSKAALLAGYTSTNVPNLTSIVRVTSVGTCTNHVDIGVDDPTVTVYSRCSDGFIAYIETATANGAFTTDAGGTNCYQRLDSGALTAMNAAYPGMTYVGTLHNTTCACV